MIPNRPMASAEWAHLAWGERPEGVGITVPADALDQLLREIVFLNQLRATLEQNLKVTVETTGVST